MVNTFSLQLQPPLWDSYPYGQQSSLKKICTHVQNLFLFCSQLSQLLTIQLAWVRYNLRIFSLSGAHMDPKDNF